MARNDTRNSWYNYQTAQLTQPQTTQQPASTFTRDMTTPAPSAQQAVPSAAQQVPTTLESSYYTAGLLRQFIGQLMRVQFLIGTTGPLVDRVGTLVDVGANYIILQPTASDDLVIADLYSIKFVDVLR